MRLSRRTRRMLARNVVVGLLSGGVFWAFWSSRGQWDPEMRLWKAFGDASFALLALTLAVGPVARLWAPARRLLPWRRQTGIWFALLATVHAALVFNGWARWSVDRLLGYEFVPQLGRSARLEPGFGLANLIGILALFWALVLLATSSDRALRYLGGQAWKWLHSGAYVVFYLSAAHTAYFLFIHYTLSFHRDVPPPDWFRIPFLVVAGSVVTLQAAAFAKTVVAGRRSRAREDERPPETRIAPPRKRRSKTRSARS